MITKVTNVEKGGENGWKKYYRQKNIIKTCN